MRRLALALALMLVAGPAAAEQLELYDGRLSAKLPDDYFTRLPKEQLTGSLSGEDYVFISRDGNRILLIRNQQSTEMTGVPLEVLGRRHADAVLAAKDLVLRQDMVRLNGRDWYLVEYQTVVDTRQAYLTLLEPDRLVVFAASMLGLGRRMDPNSDSILQDVVGSIKVR